MLKSRIFYLILGILIGSMLFATVTMAAPQIRLIVNGTDITDQFDYKPMLINERTYVPARPLAEALGATVTWDSSRNAVIVNTGAYQQPNETASSNQFTGIWSYENEEQGWGLALDISRFEDTILGNHAAYAYFGNRLDIGYDVSIYGDFVSSNQVVVLWDSGYGDVSGTATLTFNNDGSLYWEINDVFQTGDFSEYYIPQKALLIRN
ncbi:copper amine oxidase N-terminal domain-containing protein [Heliorestis convoluta]|uniref:Copper amine oxidase N-terminal domain-containing protein n=1 Tax=Heliorestis convoluta TaxID=356322 RepID=A0A5Q2N6U7_9FIRM|nr:copper amine oxidase N-terminal domain-containing protein [Heliorestis convoluta]QGG48000.1 copper amine oxidase N-terminal domain-containing protein [Heliorestis convoluta]